MHNELRDRVHQLNVQAGWWTNIQTNESILETRNRPEMMLLTMSELCEATHTPNDPDSHVPQFSVFKVELADAAIRTLDQAGADGIELDDAQYQFTDVNNWFYELTNLICHDALQAYRKNKTEAYHEAVGKFYKGLFALAERTDFDLIEVIEAKLEYNANRADHKIENRLKGDGKKI